MGTVAAQDQTFGVSQSQVDVDFHAVFMRGKIDWGPEGDAVGGRFLRVEFCSQEVFDQICFSLGIEVEGSVTEDDATAQGNFCFPWIQIGMEIS